MDAIRFDSPRTSAESSALRKWLTDNGRVATDATADYTVLNWTAKDYGQDGDASIVRDVDNKRVHYAAVVNLANRPEGEPLRAERRFVQLDTEPTPFPAELAARRVTV